MSDPLLALQDERVPYYYSGYSSLDCYFRVRNPGCVYIATTASLITLAKLFGDLSYPGLPLEDAAIETDSTRYVFRCVDHVAQPPSDPYTVLALLYNPQKGSFLDPLGVYADLRRTQLVAVESWLPEWVFLMEAAKLVSRYHYAVDDACGLAPGSVTSFPSDTERERDLLVSILRSPKPDKGFLLLLKSGFVEAFWPELFRMTEVSQSKDYHPEGNVWEHTMAALRHRRGLDLLLALGLLLHDIGKPYTTKWGDRQFDGHAEQGALVAGRFMRRLGFPDRMVVDVQFMVRFHMIPQALKRLPLYRTQKLLDSRLFPRLLEIYRADIASSYHALDAYFEACKVYRRYLKKKTNTYGFERTRSDSKHRRRARYRRTTHKCY